MLNLGNRGAYWDRVRWLLRSSVHEGPWPMMDRLVVQNSPNFQIHHINISMVIIFSYAQQLCVFSEEKILQ